MKKEKNKLGFKKKLTKEELEELQAEQNAEVIIDGAANQAFASEVVASAPHYAEAATIATDAVVAGTAGGGIGMGSIALGVVALGAVGAAAGGGGGGSSGGDTNTPTDTIAPSATITLSDTALTVGETATATIVFSEAVTGVEIADFTADNGVLSNLSTADNITYTALFTPNSDINDTSNIITLAANSYKDNAGNDGSGATSDNYTVNTTTDTVAPTTTLSNNSIEETVLYIGTIKNWVDPTMRKVGELSSDEGSVIYSIEPNDTFELRTENGITSVYVKASVVLDYETISSYDIDITSTDSSNNARTQTFTINVTDYTGNYTGTTGNDWIGGTSEVDTINGNDGDDDIAGNNGSDTFNGGNGSDTAWFGDTLSITTGVTVDLLSGTAIDQYGNTDTLISIENILGSDFVDTITGDAGNNILDGWIGNDTIIGGGGDDTIIGGITTDAEVMTGGIGSDTFKYLTVSHGVFTYDMVMTQATIDTITDFTTNLDGVFDAGEDMLDLREFLYQDDTYYVQTDYRANIEGYFQVNANGDLLVDRDGYDLNGYNFAYVANVGQQWSTDDIINLINAGQILV